MSNEPLSALSSGTIAHSSSSQSVSNARSVASIGAEIRVPVEKKFSKLAISDHVKNAITSLGDVNGSSRDSIASYLTSRDLVNEQMSKSAVTQALNRLIKKGDVNLEVNGCFKLGQKRAYNRKAPLQKKRGATNLKIEIEIGYKFEEPENSSAEEE